MTKTGFKNNISRDSSYIVISMSNIKKYQKEITATKESARTFLNKIGFYEKSNNNKKASSAL